MVGLWKAGAVILLALIQCNLASGANNTTAAAPLGKVGSTTGLPTTAPTTVSPGNLSASDAPTQARSKTPDPIQPPVNFTFNFDKKKDGKGPCRSVIKVDYWNYAPYIYEENGTVHGVLKEVAEELIWKCCLVPTGAPQNTTQYDQCISARDDPDSLASCLMRFNYTDSPTQEPEELKNRITWAGNMMSLPIYGQISDTTFRSQHYYAVIESPGILYIAAPPSKEDPNVTGQVMMAVFGGWPVLVLTLLLAALSGVVIWALDSYWNPEEFPAQFLPGIWEGFWWAFVSMTTVGYGDRAPKSFIARLFAFFWVLIGLVIIGIFTATVTTSLTTLTLDNDINLFGSDIVVLKNSIEKDYGTQTNAKIQEVADLDTFLATLQSNQAKGGLIDAYHAGKYAKKIDAKGDLNFAEVFEDFDYSHGFALANSLNDNEFSKCVRRGLSEKEDDINERIMNDLKILTQKSSAAEQKSQGLFDASSPIFLDSVKIACGCIAFGLLCGMIYELVWYQRKLKQDGDPDEKRVVDANTSFDTLVAEQCKEIENSMVAQVMNFYQAFHDKLEEIKTKRVADQAS